jgi:hypothetical protein
MEENEEKSVKMTPLAKPSASFSLVSFLFLLFYSVFFIASFFQKDALIFHYFFCWENRSFCWSMIGLAMALFASTSLYSSIAKKPTKSVPLFFAAGLLAYALAMAIVACTYLGQPYGLDSLLYCLFVALILLLLSLNVFYYAFSWRLYFYALGDASVVLTRWESKRLTSNPETNKKVSQVLFGGLSWLFFLGALVICLLIYPDVTSSDGSALMMLYILLAGLTPYPLLVFAAYLIGGWHFNLWVMAKGRSKHSRWMVVPLLAGLAIGVIGMPVAYTEGRRHVEWTQTYTPEKWIAGDGDDRSRMLSDFESKVDLKGKTGDEVECYLGEPDKSNDENGLLNWDYSLGIYSGMHHSYDRYYRVSFSEGSVFETSTFSVMD